MDYLKSIFTWIHCDFYSRVSFLIGLILVLIEPGISNLLINHLNWFHQWDVFIILLFSAFYGLTDVLVCLLLILNPQTNDLNKNQRVRCLIEDARIINIEVLISKAFQIHFVYYFSIHERMIAILGLLINGIICCSFIRWKQNRMIKSKNLNSPYPLRIMYIIQFLYLE